MITMKINRVDYNNNNTPVLYDREIGGFAHDVIEDYKPNLLREPGMIRFEHFLESYLGVTLMFKDIYNPDPDKKILGAVAFRGGTLKVFDRENMRVSNMLVKENTVIIDNFVMEPGREGLAMFTGLHEGGHLMIHPKVYKIYEEENNNINKKRLPPIVYCRRDTVENFGGSRSLKTAKSWMEHHADCFAASLAMPNATFIPFVNQLMREYDVWKGHIVLNQDDDLDILAKDLLPERITEVYGVSKRAALIKLKKSGFVVDS
ncbi:MAG: ImmA/IrrE family metallo-endopeptidase [Oscillospiraceae bacterium]|nr:ImmA/IrrE family metallo-endopeptidase [Oscillospiraceae bacterium]